MQRPPLERRKSFWFGAIVLIFLAWAAWQSFDRPYRLYGWDTGKHTLGFTRMNGSTYILQGWTGSPKGWVNEVLGSIPAPQWVPIWKREGIRAWRLPDAATAGLFVIVWVAWLAWLERKGRIENETKCRA